MDLIFGANGLVGSHLRAQLQHAVPDTTTDITSVIDVMRVVHDVAPRIIYLAAAMTDVDACESASGEEASYRVNVQGVVNVVRAARRYGAKVVFLSTDYIFDGTNGPYSLGAVPNPISVYGRHKLQAEHYVATQAPTWAIIRTTLVYGAHLKRRNFVYAVTSALRANRVFRAVTDQLGTPTYAPELARMAIELAYTETGVFHVAGPDCSNRYDWACRIAEVYKLDLKLIQPVRTADLHQFAPRPLNAGLIETTWPVGLDLETCLQDMRAHE